MIVPSIDIAGGETVQLVGGKELALSAGDPLPLAQRFGRVGEVAVIDLDAALSRGNNESQIREVLQKAPCRVGGGIRDVDTAIRWLDAGAAKVILGTVATPDVLSALPQDRVIAALDAMHDPTSTETQDGRVVDHGWTQETGSTVLDRIEQLRGYVSGFLITFVEREGQMTGIDRDTVARYVEAAGPARVTIAGGIATVDEIAELDRLGADAQVGMALYTGRIGLAEAYCSPLFSDRPDGLWPTVVVDQRGVALGLCYSNVESVSRSLETGQAHYWSRKRGLWKKGSTSGNTQTLLGIDVDCDRDTLRFRVQQTGAGFCHLQQSTCFGSVTGLSQLERTLQDRLENDVDASFVRKLFGSPEFLASKVVEEAHELNSAVARADIVHEAADVIFFTMARAAKERIGLDEIERELDRRALRVTRRDTQAVKHEPQGASPRF